MSRRIDEAIELLEAERRELVPETVDGTHARELVEKFARGERLMAAGKALALRQVAATRSWKQAGSYRDVTAWLASVSGATIGQAVATVATAQRLKSLPDTEAALRASELSPAQADVISDAASVDRNSERELLHTAANEGLRGLRTAAARVKAAVCADVVARDDHIRAARSLQHWTDLDGTGRIDVRGPVLDVARVMAALEAFERSQFDEARTAGTYERADVYSFDALVALADAAPGPLPRSPVEQAAWHCTGRRRPRVRRVLHRRVSRDPASRDRPQRPAGSRRPVRARQPHAALQVPPPRQAPARRSTRGGGKLQAPPHDRRAAAARERVNCEHEHRRPRTAVDHARRLSLSGDG
jgi:hypothetical protein